jgi:hypothetical protein
MKPQAPLSRLSQATCLKEAAGISKVLVLNLDQPDAAALEPRNAHQARSVVCTKFLVFHIFLMGDRPEIRLPIALIAPIYVVDLGRQAAIAKQPDHAMSQQKTTEDLDLQIAFAIRGSRFAPGVLRVPGVSNARAREMARRAPLPDQKVITNLETLPEDLDVMGAGRAEVRAVQETHDAGDVAG